jgi:hypothetical protein
MDPSPAASPLLRTLLAILPLALSLTLAWALTGLLSLGGGEKDVLLALPVIAWSLLFLLISVGLWWRNVPLGITIAWAAGSSTVLVVVALVGLFVLAQAGAGA